MNFKSYPFKEFIQLTLGDLGFEVTTAIQEQVIPKVLMGQNVIGKSATGSGKTLAFLLPILQRLNLNEKTVQAVIVSPTRELALQIYTECMRFVKHEPNLDVRLLVGGTDRDQELNRLQTSQPHIVVGTLGKLKDLGIDSNALKLYTAKVVVIDEADMVFDMSEMEEIDGVFSIFTANAQMLTFSATMTLHITQFIKKYLSKAELIDLSSKELSKSTISHLFLPTKNKNKFEVLHQLLQTFVPYMVIIFANTKETVDAVTDFLTDKNYKLLKLTGDLQSRERKQVLKRIKDGQIQYVVASDIASRGLDIEGISHIINFDLPSDVEFYVHRTGRTARHTFTGQAISLYEYEDNQYLDRLEAKGLTCTYVALKDQSLVTVRGRNFWKKTPRFVKKAEEDMHKKIPVAKKVKPGHKKKRLETINRELNKMKRARIDDLYHKRSHKE
ncbi:MAG: DEAD/DEAH box helicase [Bacilli bacterium]|nr:DEAD/DEAH box helicase [Bacilli bacterium]